MTETRKRSLCSLLRVVAYSFLDEQSADGQTTALALEEKLRQEVSAHLDLYEQGLIDPVAELAARGKRTGFSNPAEPAPLTGLNLGPLIDD